MVHFIGAGPGGADLITVRGAKLLGEADVIIYAGSLVNPALLDYKKEGCQVFGKLPGLHLPLCDIFQHGFVGRIEHVPEHFPLVEIRFFHHLGNQILFAQLLHHSGQFPVKRPPLQVIQNP